MEKQQAKRPIVNGKAKTASYEEHEELDILDSLDLKDSSGHVNLKDLLLEVGNDADESLRDLGEVLQKRMLEGNGETLFDLGQEDNGGSMAFSKEQWDVALDRIRKAAASVKANCQVLMTRNVGEATDVDPVSEKDTSCTGKVMIRQEPETPEDVIETRIAVVGNGTRYNCEQTFSQLIGHQSRRRQKHHAGCSGQRNPR